MSDTEHKTEREDAARALRAWDGRLTRSLSLELADTMLSPVWDRAEAAEAERDVLRDRLAAAEDIIRHYIVLRDPENLAAMDVEARAFLASPKDGEPT